MPKNDSQAVTCVFKHFKLKVLLLGTRNERKYYYEHSVICGFLLMNEVMVTWRHLLLPSDFLVMEPTF